MKKIVILILCSILICPACFPRGKSSEQDVLFQRATIHSLLEGVYDGTLTLKELQTHGNFGIGTYNALDGEMIFLDNVFYQIKADGLAYQPPLKTLTPFACATFFSPDSTSAIEEPLQYDELKARIDSLLQSTNIPYAVKITGSFDYVKTRSVPRQAKPYLPLSEITKSQPVFELNNVRGTLVGFRLPEDFKGLNVPGFHLHFIDAGHTRGGHLLDCTIKNVKIEIDGTADIFLSLPTSLPFLSADLDSPSSAEIKKVENGAGN